MFKYFVKVERYYFIEVFVFVQKVFLYLEIKKVGFSNKYYVYQMIVLEFFNEDFGKLGYVFGNLYRYFLVREGGGRKK